MKKIILSPPFGERFNFIKNVTRVVGSMTVPERPGRYKQAIKTIRPLKRNGEISWINKIGLRTVGMEQFKTFAKSDEILSIAAIEYQDWEVFLKKIEEHNSYHFKNLEINLGCPNTNTSFLLYDDVIPFLKHFEKVIIKLSPKQSNFEVIEQFKERGVDLFHLFNTYPTKKGGVSGPFLKNVVFRLLKQFKPKEKGISFIAGGGIYSLDDVKCYEELGADYYSLSTVFYNPFRGVQLVNQINNYFK